MARAHFVQVRDAVSRPRGGDLRAARVFRVDFQKAPVPADGLNDGGSLLSLLDDVIRHFESEDRAPVALAPGPASPLVGACLLALLAPRLQTPDVLAAVDALTQRQQSFARAFASAARCRDREASGVAADLRRPFPEESF